MVGFPQHKLETCLEKLLQAGHRVAICEPIAEDVKDVRREITRIVELLRRDNQGEQSNACTHTQRGGRYLLRAFRKNEKN